MKDPIKLYRVSKYLWTIVRDKLVWCDEDDFHFILQRFILLACGSLIRLLSTLHRRLVAKISRERREGYYGKGKVVFQKLGCLDDSRVGLLY